MNAGTATALSVVPGGAVLAALDLPDSGVLTDWARVLESGLDLEGQSFLAGVRLAFQAVAFLVLLFAVVVRLSGEESTRELVSAMAVPVLCAACAAAVPDFARGAGGAVWELVSGSGHTPAEAAPRWLERASPWLRAGSPVREAIARERLPVDWLDDLWTELESGHGLTSTSSAGLWSLATKTESGRALFLAGSGVGLGLVAASIQGVWCAPLHQLVLEVLLLVAPVACACLAMDRSAGVARGFLVRLASVVFWPVGWACANWVGRVLLDAALAQLNGDWSSVPPGALLDAIAVMPYRGACVGIVGCLVSTAWILVCPLVIPIVCTLLIPGAWLGRTAAVSSEAAPAPATVANQRVTLEPGGAV